MGYKTLFEQIKTVCAWNSLREASHQGAIYVTVSDNKDTYYTYTVQYRSNDTSEK